MTTRDVLLIFIGLAITGALGSLGVAAFMLIKGI